LRDVLAAAAGCCCCLLMSIKTNGYRVKDFDMQTVSFGFIARMSFCMIINVFFLSVQSGIFIEQNKNSNPA
jgi:hypothetical protein